MPYIFKKYYPIRKILFFFGEGILIYVSLAAISYYIRGSESFLSNTYIYLFRPFLVTLTFQLSLYFFDLYDLDEPLSPPETLSRIVQSFGTACIILAVIYYLFPLCIMPSQIFFSGFLALCLSVLVWRYAYNHIINKNILTYPIIILGTGKIASDIAFEIEKKRDSGFRVEGFIGDANTPYRLPAHIPIKSNESSLLQFCKEKNIERIIVALDDRRGKMPIQELMLCKFQGIPTENGLKFFERLTGKILVEHVNPDWIIFSPGFYKGRLLTFSKQFGDTILAIFGLLITLPITVISALIIKLESPGPVFYTQERIGENGITFQLYKFRSMRDDAEKDGPQWATVNDSRVTRFGRFIRKVRIDELPQMINVLKGEMSFVGPRPERPNFVEQLAKSIPYYPIRHIVKPGISGWAQICYPYGASEEDALHKLEYDLYYIKYMSLQLDLWVIFQTIKTVLFQKGSR